MDTVNLAAKFAQFSDHWNPRIIGEVNDFQVKAAKLKGAFDWHHHAAEDELFLVVKGTLTMNFRDRTATIGPGEFIVVPHGVEHQPVAEEEVEVLLFERATTLNTGTERTARTRDTLERL